jgi:excisionase family DNA binding protein
MMNIEPQVTGGKPFKASGIRPAAWRIKDGAAQLGVSRSSIYKMAAKGEILLLKIGGRVVIPDAEIQRLASAEFQAKSLLVDDEYLRRLCAHLHRLGERSVYEFVREIIGGADPVDRLAAYSRLDPGVLAGGDRLPVTEVRQ